MNSKNIHRLAPLQEPLSTAAFSRWSGSSIQSAVETRPFEKSELIKRGWLMHIIIEPGVWWANYSNIGQIRSWAGNKLHCIMPYWNINKVLTSVGLSFNTGRKEFNEEADVFLDFLFKLEMEFYQYYLVPDGLGGAIYFHSDEFAIFVGNGADFDSIFKPYVSGLYPSNQVAFEKTQRAAEKDGYGAVLARKLASYLEDYSDVLAERAIVAAK